MTQWFYIHCPSHQSWAGLRVVLSHVPHLETGRPSWWNQMFAGAPWAAKLGLSVVSPPLVSTFLWLPPLVSLNHCFPAGDIQECCSPSLLVSMSRLLTSSMNTISLSVFFLFFLRFRSMPSGCSPPPCLSSALHFLFSSSFLFPVTRKVFFLSVPG